MFASTNYTSTAIRNYTIAAVTVLTLSMEIGRAHV